MRVLLDESLPRPLAALIAGHDVETVAAMGWSGKTNGELLRLAARSFDVLVTADRNLEHQQNQTTLPISARSSCRPYQPTRILDASRSAIASASADAATA